MVFIQSGIRLCVNLASIVHNIKEISAYCGYRAGICAVIKSNAYGHGIVETAKAANNFCRMFAVARMYEARKLRESGIKKEILVLSEFDAFSVRYAAKHNITLTLWDIQQLYDCLDYTQKLKKPLSVHIKIDTGMNRLGFKQLESLEQIFDVASLGNINISGIYTHFSNCKDADFTNLQFERFMEYVNFAKNLKPSLIAHCASSDAVFLNKKYHLDMVRPGIAIYGLNPKAALSCGVALKTAMEVKSSVISVKSVNKGEFVGYDNSYYVADSGINCAVVSAGYGDGYKRINSNNAKVYIGKNPYEIIGNVCMDLFMVKADETVFKGENVLLMSNAYEEISFDKFAKSANTIVYEIVTSFTERATREYIYPC